MRKSRSKHDLSVNIWNHLSIVGEGAEIKALASVKIWNHLSVVSEEVKNLPDKIGNHLSAVSEDVKI